MDSISEHLRNVHSHIPAGVTLVCVSKFHPVEAINQAYEAGERHFGESRVQELQTKVPQLPEDIRWHFIGHLQTNKVRDLLRLHPYLIHSVDSIHLLQTINDEAARLGIVQDILLEVHVAKEETKTGFTSDEIVCLQNRFSEYPNVCVRGLMAMATNTEDEHEIRRCFTDAERLYSNIFNANNILSMGMSDDYQLAIECGSTMVRIGSYIFGEREYNIKK
ncbi:MAG: YggS family pyridoxal phosphate-dependent enzyme [Paludibacteraceae bacterium]|nr:YggS family pyridoxal phosphate-dependent enzyme [Paludibacteraceae bacterium]